MAQQVTVRAKGLYLAPNDLGEVPDGALAQADNVVISREGVVECRRGLLGPTLVATNRAGRLFAFAGGLVSGRRDITGLWNDYYSTNGTTWTIWTAPYSLPLSSFIHQEIDTGGLAYHTEGLGIRVVESLGANIKWAGGGTASSVNATLAGGVGTAVPTATQVAYRALWLWKDINGAEHVSSPSSRALITNASGSTKDITLDVTAPNMCAEPATMRLYRSPSVATSITPTDVMGLVYERTVNLLGSNGAAATRATNVVTVTTLSPHGYKSSDAIYVTASTGGLSTGYFVLSSAPTSTTFQYTDTAADTTGTINYSLNSAVVTADKLPDSLLGAEIYTSPNQEGIAQSNYPPPTAFQIAAFRGHMFYADAYDNPSSTLSLSSTVAAAGGLASGDTVTLNGTFTFTAGGAEVYSSRTFHVFTGGTPASDIAATVESLVRVMNATLSGTYALGSGLAPMYRALKVDDDSYPGRFTVTVQATYNGGLTVSLDSSRTTCWVEALPTSGPSPRRGNRIWWSKNGNAGAVPLLNYADVGSSAYPIKRIVPTRDALFIFKDDGVWRLTGSGGVWDIQPLDPTMGWPAPETLVPFENAVFGICDSGIARVTESGVEMVSTPIYPALEQLFAPAVRATLAATAFGIAYHSAHKYIIWLPTAAGDTVAKQAFVYDSWTNAWTRWLPPTGVTGFYHGLVNPADDRLYMVDGSNVWQERKAFADTDFRDGPTNTEYAIPLTVKYAPRFGGNPGLLHQFRECALVFRRVQFGTASVGFSTNVSPAEETITLTGSDYGVSAAAGTQTTVRALVPLEKARGSQLNVKFSHAQAGQPVELQGLSVVFNPGSTRVSR